MTKLGKVLPSPKPKHLDFLVFKFDDNNFAKHPYTNFFPCYRTVLCHAIIRHFFANQETDYSETFTNCMAKLKTYLEEANHNDGFVEKFVDLLPLTENKGYILVDHSKGYYPLVLSRDTKEGSSSSREEGFIEAVNDLYENRQPIIEITNVFKTELENAYKEDYWLKSFQSELQNKFHYPKKTKKHQG